MFNNILVTVGIYKTYISISNCSPAFWFLSYFHLTVFHFPPFSSPWLCLLLHLEEQPRENVKAKLPFLVIRLYPAVLARKYAWSSRHLTVLWMRCECWPYLGGVPAVCSALRWSEISRPSKSLPSLTCLCAVLCVSYTGLSASLAS